MLEATLCFLVDGNPPARILLGHKKVGFGQGKWGGVGGKLEPGETPAQAAIREVYEETGVGVQEVDLCRAAHLTFLFPCKPEWSQVVHVFVAYRWEGQASESHEIAPAWFDVEQIPYAQMWDDCRHWLPEVLAGTVVCAVFTFGRDNETVEQIELKHETQDTDSPIQKLDAVLDRLIALLMADDQIRWAGALRRIQDELRGNPIRGATTLMHIYGSAGSFNDLVLGQHIEGGQLAWQENAAAMNNQLQDLQRQAWTLALAIRDEVC